MAKNVATQLLDILANMGVKQIFGVTGDALNFFVKAIEEQDQVEWIGMKHEGNASFAAFAQGELGNTIGVCAGTTGPGALHLINGLYNAKKERTPVLAITGQIPLKKMGTSYFQEVDLQKMFDDVCDYQITRINFDPTRFYISKTTSGGKRIDFSILNFGIFC